MTQGMQFHLGGTVIFIGKETNIENDAVKTPLKQYEVGCCKYLSAESHMPSVL